MEDCDEIGTNGKAVANRNERQATSWAAVLVLIYLHPRKRHFPKITVFNAEVRYSGEINGLRQSSSGALGKGHLVGGRGGLIDSDGVGYIVRLGSQGWAKSLRRIKCFVCLTSSMLGGAARSMKRAGQEYESFTLVACCVVHSSPERLKVVSCPSHVRCIIR